MRKKISLVLLCGVILLGVCGCGSKKDLTGTYKVSVSYPDSENSFEYIGTLKLFDSGSCTIKKETLLNGKKDSYFGDNEYNDCSYDVLDNTITFKYRPNDDQSYATSECSIEDNNLKCKNLGYIDTVKNELWKKQ